MFPNLFKPIVSINKTMLDKIRYRTVFNRAARLNKRGEGLVQVEMRQKGRSCYISTNVYLLPGQWKDGLVVNHPNQNDLNYTLGKMRHDCEEVELQFFVKGVTPTLALVKSAIKEKTSPSARLIDFGQAAVELSDRQQQTKDGYKTLFNNLQRFRKDTLVSEVDYNFIVKYDRWLMDSGIAHNTRVGRLRQLKALMGEAERREIVTRNPFENFKIPGMESKKGYVNEEQLAAIESMGDDKDVNQDVRCAFLFCCYSGLRISDLVTLESRHISADGWIHKTMIKTKLDVHVPISRLFDGKALDIIRKYGRIENLTKKLKRNPEVNKALKVVFRKAGVSGKFTFHTSRHTFASLLLNQGVPITSVQKMLGHTKLTTTQIYGEVSRDTIEKDLIRSLDGKGNNQS